MEYLDIIVIIMIRKKIKFILYNSLFLKFIGFFQHCIMKTFKHNCKIYHENLPVYHLAFTAHFVIHLYNYLSLAIDQPV